MLVAFNGRCLMLFALSGYVQEKVVDVISEVYDRLVMSFAVVLDVVAEVQDRYFMLFADSVRYLMLLVRCRIRYLCYQRCAPQ